MQSVFQSTFLQALGFAIANSLWQTALVWLVFMSVNSLVSLNAAVKYRLAVAAQLISFAWFIITLQFYYTQYSQAWQNTATVNTGIQSILPAGKDLSSQLIYWMVKAEQFLPYVSMAYLLLMLFLSIRWLLGYRQTQMIRNNGIHKISAEWRVFVKRVAEQLGIKKDIRIFLSDTVHTPLTIGFFKPIILIPVASINHLTTDQLEAVLLHELAHIKRYDYLVNMILSVVEITLFFNPFTQLLSKSIRKERENSCDDWVLQFKYNASVYAEALLRIAYLQPAPAFAMAASGKKNDLLFRVKRMIDKKEDRLSYRKQLLAFVVVTGMLSCIAWLNPITSPLKQQNTAAATQKKLPLQKIQPYAVEPMTVSVDNPLFNPVFFLSKPLKAEMKKNIVSAQKELDRENFKDVKEFGELIESIPPMVANALEQASHELTNQKQNWVKNLANMDLAKSELERNWSKDTAALPAKLRAPYAKEMTLNLKQMNEDIRKAKLEMEKSFKGQREIHRVQIDKEKIQREIAEALKTVNSIELEKLVTDAMNMTGLVFAELDKQVRHKRIQAPSFPKEKEILRLMNNKKFKEKESLNPLTTEEIEVADTDVDENIDVHAITLPQPPSPQEFEKIKAEITRINRLRASQLLKQMKEKSIKIISVATTDKTPEENKIVIRIQ